MMISIGGSKYINANDVVVVIDYDSIAERNYINRAKEQGMLLNISKNKKTRSVIIINSGIVLLSDIKSETIYNRINNVINE